MVELSDNIDEYRLIVLLKRVLIQDLCTTGSTSEYMMKMIIELLKFYAWTGRIVRLVEDACKKYCPQLLSRISNNVMYVEQVSKNLTYAMFVSKYLLNIIDAYTYDKQYKQKRILVHIMCDLLFHTKNLLYDTLINYQSLAERVYRTINQLAQNKAPELKEYINKAPELKEYINKYKELELKILLF